jgi:hypothetical protein
MVRWDRAFAWLLISVAAACAASRSVEQRKRAEGPCPPLPESQVVAVAGADAGERHERFDLGDGPAMWEGAREDAAAVAYRRQIGGRLGADLEPRNLLVRQREVFAGGSQARETLNIGAVLEGRVGTFVVPGCIERLLFARQAARFPMVDHATEFGAFVLRRGDRIRLYVSSMDRVGQKIRREVTERVRADVAGGYRLVAHLHNHPFLTHRRIGDRMWTTAETLADVAGALAPSLTDVQFFRNTVADGLPLEAAWITNGLDSIRIPARDFGALATHPPGG